MQLESDIVQPWLRQGLGGIMVLPVSVLTFIKALLNEVDQLACDTVIGR